VKVVPDKSGPETETVTTVNVVPDKPETETVPTVKVVPDKPETETVTTITDAPDKSEPDHSDTVKVVPDKSEPEGQLDTVTGRKSSEPIQIESQTVTIKSTGGFSVTGQTSSSEETLKVGPYKTVDQTKSEGETVSTVTASHDDVPPETVPETVPPAVTVRSARGFTVSNLPGKKLIMFKLSI
jgi:hypothetical protein